MQRIIIFANGELPELEKARQLLRTDDYIICADGGTRHALALDRRPHLVVGDMDSMVRERWQELQANGVDVELYPQDKNETDLELALERAAELDPDEILIVGALGGRLDQTIANLAILSGTREQRFNIRMDDGVEEVFFCRDQAQIHGRSGDIVSLIPWGGAVSGIQTNGLRWPLDRETLYPEKTRGISNEMLSDIATVSIKAGLLLIVHRHQSYD
jgi:thiamine pyrophosphokinase